MSDMPKTPYELAAEDRNLFGMGAVLEKPDGTVEYIPIEQLKIFTAPGPKK